MAAVCAVDGDSGCLLFCILPKTMEIITKIRIKARREPRQLPFLLCRIGGLVYRWRGGLGGGMNPPGGGPAGLRTLGRCPKEFWGLGPDDPAGREVLRRGGEL